MNLGLTGKTALITGGSRGIGAATAEVFAAEGANLILVARTAAALQHFKNRILQIASVRVETAVCDVSDSRQIEELATRFQQVDILVNNAGDMPSGNIFEVRDADWRAGWNTKVFAYINMCRAYYPILQSRGGGVIVNVSGIGAVLKRWDYICAGMGNQAVEFLTETLGARSPVDNIRVVCVSPGAVSTERQERVMADWFGEGATQPVWPFGRRATPEELGSAIVMLASDRSAYTSGCVYTVDGGASISRVV